MVSTPYASQTLDHLGIVAGICDQIQLVERINTFVGKTDRKVCVGRVVKGLVLNGLGFVGRPLYFTPEFFRNKPVDMLIGPDIEADDLNDDCLGRALDVLFEKGITEVFACVAIVAVREAGVSLTTIHVDTTSFHLHGEYEFAPDEAAQAIEIKQGYSRDHRPDLKQAVLGLICTHEGGLPVWLKVLSGNEADRTSFPVIVRAYLDQMKSDKGSQTPPPYLIGDPALYNGDTLQELGEDVLWISRVPASISGVKTLYQSIQPADMQPLGEDYKVVELCAVYGEVKQRWLLVSSEKGARRDAKTIRKHIADERTEAEKRVRKFTRREYPSPEAAKAAVEAIAEGWKFHTVEVTGFVSVGKFNERVRPAAGQEPDSYVWKAVAQVVEKEAEVQAALAKAGKFVLATNDLDDQQLPAEQWLALYKGQNQTVERGFRFLKDPLFFAHSLFLKKPSRIMALLMIMGLCLLIYPLAEHLLRSELVRRNEALPNQTGKPTQRITMRRVFQMFEGIDVLIIASGQGPPQRLILNLTDLHHKILELLVPSVQRYYQLA